MVSSAYTPASPASGLFVHFTLFFRIYIVSEKIILFVIEKVCYNICA